MKVLKISFITVLFFFINHLSFAQGVDAYFYSSPFYAPGHGSYVETYIAVAGNSVNYIQKPDSTLQASVEISMVFKNANEIKEYRKYKIASPPLDDTATVFPSFIDLQRIVIPSGVYNFELVVNDLYGADSVPDMEYTDILTVDFPDSTIALSGIQFLESFEQNKKRNIFVKNGYECIPYVSDFFPNQLTHIRFYLELYFAAKELGPLEDFLFFTHIEKQNTNKPIANFSSFSKQKAMNVNVLMKEINIEKLPSGNYYLVVEVRNRENKLVLKKKKFFQRSNPGVEYEKDYDYEKVEIENTFAQRFVNIDSLKFALNSLRPICDPKENQFIDNQLAANNLHLMQQFFLSFWEKRNEVNPNNAWSEYYIKISEVQQKFGSKLKPGFLTDRGRVYLQYGPPSSIVSEQNESNAYPYEIWHYYNIGDLTNKKFIFYNRDLYGKDYELLHSNMRGELSNPYWENELYSRTSNSGSGGRAKQLFEGE